VVLPSLALSKSGTMGLRKKVLISAYSSPVHILFYFSILKFFMLFVNLNK